MSEAAGDDDRAERLALLGEVAFEVAHELRNLLLIIDGSTYLAKREPSESAPHLEKIERSVRGARAIVDDVFSLARDEPLTREWVDIAEVVALARAELPEGCAHFVDALGDARLRAHDRLLARALKVLYENAVQVRGERPRIQTRCEASGGLLTVEVEDDGPGVPASLGDKIFEPLVSSRDGGTGLGLPLARRIARAHGGTLTLLPSAGRGACFRLTLPIGQ